MAKTSQDIKAAMPHAEEVEDEGTMGNSQAKLNNKWFSNVKGVIVRCGNYERHKQNARAYYLALLVNLFNNFIKSEAIEVATVRNQSEILELLSRMLEKYGINWFWDPDQEDPLSGHECNLLMYSRDQIIRLVLDLAFEACEKQNDALGLRALRIACIPYFRNKSRAATSKYGRYLISDLVIEKAASPRSRMRMDMYVTTNPSGTRGGGMYRDKFNEGSTCNVDRFTDKIFAKKKLQIWGA